MSGRLFHSKYKPENWERTVTPCGAAPATCPPCRGAWRRPGVSAERITISQNVLLSFFFALFCFFLPQCNKSKKHLHFIPFFQSDISDLLYTPTENKSFSSLFLQRIKVNLLLRKVLIWGNFRKH